MQCYQLRVKHLHIAAFSKDIICSWCYDSRATIGVRLKGPIRYNTMWSLFTVVAYLRPKLRLHGYWCIIGGSRWSGCCWSAWITTAPLELLPFTVLPTSSKYLTCELWNPQNIMWTADHVVSLNKRAFQHFGWRTLSIGDTDSESRSEDTMFTWRCETFLKTSICELMSSLFRRAELVELFREQWYSGQLRMLSQKNEDCAAIDRRMCNYYYFYWRIISNHRVHV